MGRAAAPPPPRALCGTDGVPQKAERGSRCGSGEARTCSAAQRPAPPQAPLQAAAPRAPQRRAPGASAPRRRRRCAAPPRRAPPAAPGGAAGATPRVTQARASAQPGAPAPQQGRAKQRRAGRRARLQRALVRGAALLRRRRLRRGCDGRAVGREGGLCRAGAALRRCRAGGRGLGALRCLLLPELLLLRGVRRPSETGAPLKAAGRTGEAAALGARLLLAQQIKLALQRELGLAWHRVSAQVRGSGVSARRPPLVCNDTGRRSGRKRPAVQGSPGCLQNGCLQQAAPSQSVPSCAGVGVQQAVPSRMQSLVCECWFATVLWQLTQQAANPGG